MRVPRRVAVAGGALLLLAGFSPLTAPSQAQTPGSLVKSALSVVKLGCNHASAVGSAHCYASALGRNGKPNATSAPAGLSPANIQDAYKLKGLTTGSTVAIVDAYDDKTAEADLGVYRTQYGLPSCTTKNGCFTKVNQTGAASPLPTNDVGWSTEITLDLDAVSAACPSCKILLVEANSASNADLYTAVDTAANHTKFPNVVAVSNSYGGAESSTQTTDDAHFNHPNVAITVSSGDSGYGVEYPAASKYVTAVGGTSLTTASNARGWTETAWSGAGSGCSAYDTKPSGQTTVTTQCANRAVADVSAVADPNTGLAIYDSNCDFVNQLVGNCFKGWGQVGGTSLSSPIIGAVYALAGANFSPAYLYGHTGSLFDVTSGSNGSCSGSLLCTAGPGYDGPTGLGTPNGVAGF